MCVASMVQRGSKIRPDATLADSQRAVERAQDFLEQKKRELARARAASQEHRWRASEGAAARRRIRSGQARTGAVHAVGGLVRVGDRQVLVTRLVGDVAAAGAVLVRVDLDGKFLANPPLLRSSMTNPGSCPWPTQVATQVAHNFS